MDIINSNNISTVKKGPLTGVSDENI